MPVHMLLYMHGQKREVKDMPKKGRPTTNKKTERLEIRLTPEELALMQECADKLGTNKTAIINKGVKLVKEELKKKK